MFALAASCAVLLANPPRPRLPRAVRLLLVPGAVLVAASVPVAMVALGFHYFTDIVAGTALGIGMVLLTALLIDRARPIAPRRRRRSAERWSFTVTVAAAKKSRRSGEPVAARTQ